MLTFSFSPYIWMIVFLPLWNGERWAGSLNLVFLTKSLMMFLVKTCIIVPSCFIVKTCVTYDVYLCWEHSFTASMCCEFMFSCVTFTLHDAAFGLWALLKMRVICKDVSDFIWTMNNIFHVFFLFFSFSLQYETELSSRIEVLLIK